MTEKSFRPLVAGETIGVIAPSGPPLHFHDINAGIEHLEKLGFRVKTMRSDFRPYGYLCGDDRTRLGEINAFIHQEDVAAIFCMRGGYGALRLLEGIDYDAAASHPKILVGYSDITALQMALFHRSGWRSVAGPMVGVEWPAPDPATEQLFWNLVRGDIPAPLLAPDGGGLSPLRNGVAEGVLLGGNLSMICKLVGTPYLPDLAGTLLFLEDVGEEPYRIDGLLAQLRLSGILGRLGGLLFGSFTDAQPRFERPTFSVEEVIDHYTRDLPFPVATGLVFGHFPVKPPIPIGVRGRLTVSSSEARLDVLESLT